MKLNYYFQNSKSLAVILLLTMVATSCQDKVLERYQVNTPVYLSYEDLRKSVSREEPMPLKNPGKIYFKDNFIFINEYFKGIHIYDNSNPKNPVSKGFIKIPGNVDIAIKGQTLYADSYIDLIALDISNMNDIKETSRILNVFPYAVPAKEVEVINEPIDQAKGVVIEWKVTDVEKEITNPGQYPQPLFYDDFAFAKDAVNGSFRSLASSSSVSSGSSVGIGGSMARFAIRENALYVLTNSNIRVIDISNISQPVTTNTNINSWGIETIFLKDNYMYIGANSGMSIYDITDNLNPKLLSTFSHITSCDPVVVQDDYAYVTLRSGRTCRNNFTNQLDVIDIKDKKAPKLLKSYSFTNPNGLGIDNTTLFICDGSDGLKIYNAKDIYNITSNPIAHFKNIQATDVIPVDGLLFMIGEDGFYQYDYSTVPNIVLLSKIEVEK